MKILIVYNHPYEGSYGFAILQSIIKGLQNTSHEVDVINLDKDRFNPAMTREDLKAFVEHTAVDPQVIDYQNRLKQADHLIFIFPIWWDLMPAMTKGFIDRVLSPGVAYDHHPRGYGLKPLLDKLKGITIITTMNKPKLFYSLVASNLIRKAMIRSTFKSMGYKNVRWISYNRVKSVKHSKRVQWLNDLENKFANFN